MFIVVGALVGLILIGCIGQKKLELIWEVFLSTVTLTTDFGLKDGNVGVMKGVIWRITPDVHIADISHNIIPQNIIEATLVLARSVPYFPGGSVHVIVVDPGVGTLRRPIAGRLGEQYFVAPDNGVVTMLLEWAEREGLSVEIVHLNNREYWLDRVSNVFHGRDIFAPVGGYLASGIALNELGTRINDPVRLDLPTPELKGKDLIGEVIHIDRFGNVSANIRQEHLKKDSGIKVSLGGHIIEGLAQTFGDRQVGELIALIGSSGNLIVSVVNGNAAERLGAEVGDRVDVVYMSG